MYFQVTGMLIIKTGQSRDALKLWGQPIVKVGTYKLGTKGGLKNSSYILPDLVRKIVEQIEVPPYSV